MGGFGVGFWGGGWGGGWDDNVHLPCISQVMLHYCYVLPHICTYVHTHKEDTPYLLHFPLNIDLAWGGGGFGGGGWGGGWDDNVHLPCTSQVMLHYCYVLLHICTYVHTHKEDTLIASYLLHFLVNIDLAWGGGGFGGGVGGVGGMITFICLAHHR